MARWKIALRSLKNVCAFVGAVGMFSFFYNWTVDIRHWYVTLASALACAVLWFGFYFIEIHKEALNSLKQAVAVWFSELHTKPTAPFTVTTESEEAELLWSKRFLEVC